MNTNRLIEPCRILGSCFAALIAATMLTGFNSATASTFQQVKFEIPPIAYAKDLQQPSHITIDDRDIARGYVDLQDATQMLLSANVDSCLMIVSLNALWIARAALRIGGVDHTVGSARAVLEFASKRGANVSVSVGYVIYLNKQARAGAYPWPVAFTIAPKTA